MAVKLFTTVTNTGSDKEDETVLEVSNDELNVNLKETFDLSDDPFDDQSSFSKTFAFTVPPEMAPGTYPINSKVSFNNGRDTETSTADLVVGTCQPKETQPQKQEEQPQQKPEDVVVVTTPPTTQPVTGETTAEPITPPVLPSAGKSMFEGEGFLTALVIGEVLLVIIAILVVVALTRRRN